MPRPKSDDPLVPIPARIRSSHLALLRQEAADLGVQLADHVRGKLLREDDVDQGYVNADAPTIPALVERLEASVVEARDARARHPRPAVCVCSAKDRKPTGYGVCTTCKLPTR